MELLTIIYLTMGGIMLFALGIMILIISGKSIVFDFYRIIFPKGCDVYIVNNNRQMFRYYKVPKDGVFNIRRKIYITNPDKIMSLSDDMKKEVANRLEKKKIKYNQRIQEFEEKKAEAQKSLDALGNDQLAKGQADQYRAYIETIQQRINYLRKIIHDKEQLYYNERLVAFFYIEGDPIPKDFHELYTEMDSITIDNVIARSMTKDPKAIKDFEKQIKMIKFLLFVAIIAAAAAAVLCVTIKTDLQTITQHLGIASTI